MGKEMSQVFLKKDSDDVVTADERSFFMGDYIEGVSEANATEIISGWVTNIYKDFSCKLHFEVDVDAGDGQRCYKEGAKGHITGAYPITMYTEKARR